MSIWNAPGMNKFLAQAPKEFNPGEAAIAAAQGQALGEFMGQAEAQPFSPAAAPKQAMDAEVNQVLPSFGEKPRQLNPRPAVPSGFTPAAAPKQAEEILNRYGPGIAQLVQALRG